MADKVLKMNNMSKINSTAIMNKSTSKTRTTLILNRWASCKGKKQAMKILLAKRKNANAQAYTFAITHELFILFKVFVNVSHFARANSQTKNCKRAIPSSRDKSILDD